MPLPVVSKATALTAAIVCGALALFAILIQFPMGALVCLLAGLASGLLWLVKGQRDTELAARSRPALLPGEAESGARPTKTSAGSHRLFVPPSLDARDNRS